MNAENYQQTVLWPSVEQVINDGSGVSKSVVKVTIHTLTEDYEVFQLSMLDIFRNYEGSVSDTTRATIMTPLGDYVYLIYPNRDNMEVTVSTSYIDKAGKPVGETEDVRYKAIFDTNNPTAQNPGFLGVDRDTLNNAQIMEFHLRLQDRNFEPLNACFSTGLTYRGITPKKAILAELLAESQNIVVDGSPAVAGIDMVAPDRDDVISQLALPAGTEISAIPTWIQERAGGVYKNGIGTYYQRYDSRPLWFVYPLYDYDRFAAGVDRGCVTFYSAPPELFSAIDSTYRQEGLNLSVVLTSNKQYRSKADISQINLGIGFRMADASAFMKKPVKIQEGGIAVGARANLNREVGLIERQDGLNYAPVIRDSMSNPYVETSKIAERQQSRIPLIWDNARPSLIYPGMPAKYMFIQDGELIVLVGTVLAVHAAYAMEGTAASNRFHTCTAEIVVSGIINKTGVQTLT